MNQLQSLLKRATAAEQAAEEAERKAAAAIAQSKTLEARVKALEAKVDSKAATAKGANTAKLEEQLKTLKSDNSKMQSQVDQLSKQQRAQDAQLDSVKKAHSSSEESEERGKRASKLIVTNLPEQEGEQLEGTVHRLCKALGKADVAVKSATRIGKPRTEAKLADGVEDTNPFAGLQGGRPVLVCFETVQDKHEVLKGRKNLRNSDEFKRVGLDDFLTKQQQEERSKHWPAFKAAKAAGESAYWRGEKLFINGSLHAPTTPPTN